MTGEEAAVELRRRVEALFLSARVAKDYERAAYVWINDAEAPLRTYVCFSCGYKKEEGRPHPGPFLDMPLDEMVDRMVRAIAIEFPQSAEQDCLWRIEPEYELFKATAALPEFEQPAVPEHHRLYCRVVALPAGAATVDPNRVANPTAAPAAVAASDAWFDFEEMVLHDGADTLPIRTMLDAKGHQTQDTEACVVVFAGENDRWVSAKVLRDVVVVQ